MEGAYRHPPLWPGGRGGGSPPDKTSHARPTNPTINQFDTPALTCASPEVCNRLYGKHSAGRSDLWFGWVSLHVACAPFGTHYRMDRAAYAPSISSRFSESQIRALVVDGARFRLGQWVKQLRTLKTFQEPPAPPPHAWASRTRFADQQQARPAQLYSDTFEGDIPPRQLLQLLADTDARLRSGQSIPVMSPAEEKRLTQSSAPSLADKHTQHPPHGMQPRHAKGSRPQAKKRVAGMRRSGKPSPQTNRATPTSPTASSSLVENRLHRPLVPQATSSLTSHGAHHNLQALHQAAQRHSALHASPRRAVSNRSRSHSPGSPTNSARSADVYFPPSSPLSRPAPREAAAGVLAGVPPVRAASEPTCAAHHAQTLPAVSESPAVPSSGGTALTKKQLRRQRREARARERQARLAAMAAPVPHKVSAKALTRRQRLQQELLELKRITRDAHAGLPVMMPERSSKTALDSHAIQLSASCEADNELVMAVSRARTEAAHAVEMQRLGMLPPSKQPTHESDSDKKLDRVQATAAAQNKLPNVMASRSPYAQSLAAKPGGWTTSGAGRPLTSPLKQRSKLYDGLMARPMVSSRQEFTHGDSDDMASV